MKMNAEAWENCLAEHYLRSDGPYGGTPITFIDATPEELAAASGQHGRAEEATESFLQQFSVTNVQRWLDGEYHPTAFDRAVPGYFRYLMLTCFVTATDEGAGETNNFRVRLGEILHTGSDFNAVSGVNRLWQDLATWCDRRRSRGELIRELILPDPGHMTLIGHAVRIAFPAWRDRASFARLLARIPPETRRDPQRLVQELIPPHHWNDVPEPIRNVCADFRGKIMSGQRLLSGHRFWALVLSIEDTLLDASPYPEQLDWRLEVSFGGFESDVAEFRVLRGARSSKRGASELETAFSGSLTELLAKSSESLPKPLTEALRRGVLILGESSAARWTFDGSGISDDKFSIVITRSKNVAEGLKLETFWTQLEADWFVSGRLAGFALQQLRQELGQIQNAEPKIIDVEIVGGIRTAPRVFLGRPGFLPSIVASEMSRIGFEAAAGVTDSFSVLGRPPEWSINATGPLNGRWRLTVTEGQTNVETILSFEAKAPERFDLSTTVNQPTFVTEEEVSCAGDGLGSWATSKPKNEWANASPVADLMEVIYAGAGMGWAEIDLVPLVQSVLPSKHMVWDVLRAFAEASWIEPYISQAWRARKWRLCAPSVSQAGHGRVLVEGALAAAARDRLNHLVTRAGGEIHFFSGLSVLSPPSILVSGLDAERLSSLTGWPVVELKQPTLKSAPSCWPMEKRTCDGRFLAGIWSFDNGIFVKPSAFPTQEENDLSIGRWVRERGDDRDVFRIRYHGIDFVTSSRTAAILEGYRLRQTPLFTWRHGRFMRSAKAGYLPLPVAKTLRRWSLKSSGPSSISDGCWTYSYAASAASGRWVNMIFGSAISGPIPDKHSDWLGDRVRARRSGGRAVWRSRNAASSTLWET